MPWPAERIDAGRRVQRVPLRTAVRVRPPLGADEPELPAAIRDRAPLDSQEQAYERLLQPMMPDFLSGAVENTCAIVYGHAGAGKRHTTAALLRGAADEIFAFAERNPPALVLLRVVNVRGPRLTDPLSGRGPMSFTAFPFHVQGVTERAVASASELLSLVALDDGSAEKIVYISLQRPGLQSTLTLVKLMNSDVQRPGRRGPSVAALQVALSPKMFGGRAAASARLFNFALGPNGATLLVGCVGPGRDDESLATLEFLDRVAGFECKACAGAGGGGGRLEHMLEELRLLQEEGSPEAEAVAARLVLGPPQRRVCRVVRIRPPRRRGESAATVVGPAANTVVAGGQTFAVDAVGAPAAPMRPFLADFASGAVARTHVLLCGARRTGKRFSMMGVLQQCAEAAVSVSYARLDAPDSVVEILPDTPAGSPAALLELVNGAREAAVEGTTCLGDVSPYVGEAITFRSAAGAELRLERASARCLYAPSDGCGALLVVGHVAPEASALMETLRTLEFVAGV